MEYQTPDWSDKKILIAEDEFIGKKYLEKVLSYHRAQVVFVSNGKEAVEAVRKQHFDLILMDLKMPLKSGFEATQEIKKIHPELPVIAQTALAYPGDEARARASGCDDFITKPISQDVLIKKITRFLGK